MANLSPEQSLAAAIESLGHDYGTVFFHGLQELWGITSRWDQYETLFDEPEKVALLNSTGGLFWLNVQNSLFETVMLGLCRLTDPAASMGKQNLSIQQFSKLDQSPQKDALNGLIAAAVASTAAARDWRNRKLAHNDYDRISGSAANPLATTSRREITVAIDTIHAVFQWISNTHRDSHLALTQMGDQPARQVLRVLYYGQKLLDEKRTDYEWRSTERDAAPAWIGAGPKKRYRDGLSL